MQLLIIGGTVFVGRHLVEAAQARGHTITLFNRGQHNADLFPQVEKLRGDRTQDFAALAGRHWDAVIDTCGYVPRHVHASATALAGSVDHYTFISSISVYSEFSQPGIDENSTVGTLADESCVASSASIKKGPSWEHMTDPHTKEEKTNLSTSKPLFNPLISVTQFAVLAIGHPT